MATFVLAAAFVIGGVMELKHLKSLWEKIELMQNIWTFINECPERLGYRWHLEENSQTLQKKFEALSSREKDINMQLESSELRCGNKRKREVENWLRNVSRKRNDVQRIEQQVGERKYLFRLWLGKSVRKNLFRPWLGKSVKKSIQEVEELLAEGEFSEGLLLDAREIGGEALLSTTLAGQVKANLERIWELLLKDDVLSIGIHGIIGVGKTNMLIHVHNRVLENTNTFNHVFWVTASEVSSIHELQNDVAKQVKLDLSDEEDVRKRAAKLCRVLTKKGRTVLILDDLRKHFHLDEVGIPTQVNGCKLITSTRSFHMCRKMGCEETIKVEPLPEDEAEELFKKKLGLKNLPLAPEVDEIAKLIIKECEGLPLGIVKLAERMRGVDDISEWRNTLNEVREFRKGFSDYSDMSFLCN